MLTMNVKKLIVFRFGRLARYVVGIMATDDLQVA